MQETQDKSTDRNLLVLVKHPDHWECQIQGHGIDMVGDSPEAMFKQHLRFLHIRFMQELDNVRLITTNIIKS